MEKLYRKLGLTGGASIALGIIAVTIGVVTGVLAIVMGASLLGGRKDMTI